MNKKYRIIIFLIVIAVCTGLIYWQTTKKGIIEKRIGKVVSKKSDSLYTIRYDSSSIDELNGNASFYNVSVSSDTTTSESRRAENTYNVQIAKVSIKGANVVGLLTGNTLQAKSIHFINPVFKIVKQNEAVQTFTKEDTLALYEQILGRYKSIKADLITVDQGQINITDRVNNTSSSVNGIDIKLNDFKVDSTKDYENLVSYFIKGINANVTLVSLNPSPTDRVLISGIAFNAASQLMTIKNVQQIRSNKMVTDFKNISLNGMATGVFIRQQRIEANELHTDGGMFTLYRKKGKDRNTFETDSSVFDKAKIRKVSIGKTKVTVINRDKLGDPPLILNNVQLTATDIPLIENGSLTKLIASSNWILRGDGLQMQTESKDHRITIGPFVIDKYRQFAQFERFLLTPVLTEAAFVKSRKVQEDYIQLELKNISFTKLDLEQAFAMQALHAAEVRLQPVIKIFNDRTLPRNLASKIPNDPALLIKNINHPLHFQKVIISNGHIAYRERGMISAKSGRLFFDNLNAVITNVTNIQSVYRENPEMVLQATARFMGKPEFETTWKLPLNKDNAPFSLKGRLGAIDGQLLNVVLEPLAMISLKKGSIKSFAFQTNGDYSQAHTKGTLLYDDLKLNLLKKENDEIQLQRKTALSFLANIFINDRNPNNGLVRQNEVDFKRDSSRSFFYLVSQSFFLAMKKTITGKNNVK